MEGKIYKISGWTREDYEREIESLREDNDQWKAWGMKAGDEIAALKDEIKSLREQLHALRLKFTDEKYPELLEAEARVDEWKRRARVYYDHSTAWTASLPEEAFKWFEEE